MRLEMVVGMELFGVGIRHSDFEFFVTGQTQPIAELDKMRLEITET